MQYLVIAHDGTDPEAQARRQAIRSTHLDGIRPLVEQGKILVGGAILDEAGAMVGSVVIANFASKAELNAWLEVEPYVTGGVWATVDVRPFRPAVGAWMPDA